MIYLSLCACKSNEEKLINTAWKCEYTITNERGIVDNCYFTKVFGKEGKFYDCEIINGKLNNFKLQNGCYLDLCKGQSIWEFRDDTLKTPMGNYFVIKLNSDSLVLDDFHYKKSIHLKRISLKLPENIK